MNPILRPRQAIPLIGLKNDQLDAIDSHTYGRRETDQCHAQMLLEFRRDMAEMRTQMLPAIFIAAGLIIAAVGVLIAVLD